MFYTYSQNNSGGGFDYDEARGITTYVIVEAGDAEEADFRAKRVGLYFDGAGDCECCGNRWSEAWESAGTVAPSIYETPLDAYEREAYFWIKRGFNAFIHHASGEIVGALPGPQMGGDA